jgi:carbon storage regulator CsrA
VLAVEGERDKLGITAPRDVVILRQEIYQAVQEQSRIQADLAQDPDAKHFEELRKFLAEEINEDEPAQAEDDQE